MLKQIFSIFFVCVIQSIAFSQGPPPPMDMATEENQVLIDEIIKITKIKEHYAQTCTYFIERTAKEKGWDSKEVEKRMQRINIDNFIEMNFYNTMATFSSEELKEIITFLKKVNQKTPYTSFFLSDSILVNNLFNHMQHMIE
ncbi:MAG: hypothetical protein M9916_07350 [Crocinitomicaceae bacterium]|nr:hypothetical protein [Crocinitomicaceae bacterium]